MNRMQNREGKKMRKRRSRKAKAKEEKKKNRKKKGTEQKSVSHSVNQTNITTNVKNNAPPLLIRYNAVYRVTICLLQNTAEHSRPHRALQDLPIVSSATQPMRTRRNKDE